MNKAKIISFCGRIPLFGALLRSLARRYPEDSVVTIKNGHISGYRWKRSHRYVSGYWLGIYEMPIQECLVRELKPGDVFYDIGANAGFFSLLGAKCVGNQGHVFAFEPLHENAEYIRSQLTLNEITNCTIVEAAVADRQGSVMFCEGKNTSTARIKREVENSSVPSTMKVEAIRLDDFTKTSLAPNFIKMDIEGAELLALRGAVGLLGGRTQPRLLIEFHGEQSRIESFSFLEAFGYRFFPVKGVVLDQASTERHILCIPA